MCVVLLVLVTLNMAQKRVSLGSWVRKKNAESVRIRTSVNDDFVIG